jgi:hypothetical protein
MSKKVKERILEVINDELYVPLTPPDLYSLVGEDKYDVADFLTLFAEWKKIMKFP